MKKLTPLEAKGKIQRYCAYQERSHQEVRDKLYSFGLFRDEVDQLLTDLITDGFLNEERFAKAFVGGKFRMKKWGRIKIVNALESHGLSKNCIKIGLKEIDNNDYLHTLNSILEKKGDEVDEPNIFAKRDKLSKFAIQKGYEPDLVWKILKELFPDQR
ncbi:MAG TPA: regulatory protein RecX [Chryseosolibacter sp.]